MLPSRFTVFKIWATFLGFGTLCGSSAGRATFTPTTMGMMIMCRGLYGQGERFSYLYIVVNTCAAPCHANGNATIIDEPALILSHGHGCRASLSVLGNFKKV
ncbi:hypothetical protein F4808DRAFT_112752 [Astrocystis sublimbata]|nr:hypothetical protein F4808DRAFT_112752 [Astrocystis sublimbata]